MKSANTHPSPSDIRRRTKQRFALRIFALAFTVMSLALAYWIITVRRPAVNSGYDVMDRPAITTLALALGLAITAVVSLAAQKEEPRPPLGRMLGSTILTATAAGLIGWIVGICLSVNKKTQLGLPTTYTSPPAAVHNMHEAWLFTGLVVVGIFCGLVVVYLAPPARQP